MTPVAQTIAALAVLHALVSDRVGGDEAYDGPEPRDLHWVSDWDADHIALAEEDRTERQRRWFEC